VMNGLARDARLGGDFLDGEGGGVGLEATAGGAQDRVAGRFGGSGGAGPGEWPGQWSGEWPGEWSCA
jgi:hypothetical protein